MFNERKSIHETSHYRRAVGVFRRQEDLEDAIRALKNAGIDMQRVSLIARNIDDVEGAKEITEQHGNEAKEGAAAGAVTGTVLGGLTGFLIGVGLLAIPGVGPLLAAGVEISALGSTLAGAGIGAAAGGIIGALVGMGIPEEKAKVYDQRVKAGDYLLMVSGTEDSLRRIESIMRDRHVEEFGIYDAPDLASSETVETRERVATREVPTRTRDLDVDGDPEVIIIDKRDEVR